MPQALLIGGPRSRMRMEVGVRPVDTIVLTSEDSEHRYWYAGNMPLLHGSRIWVYRHESISMEEMKSCVELAHPVEHTIATMPRSTGLQAPLPA